MPKHNAFNQSGNILISDQFNNRVIEVSPRGEIIWSFGRGPNDFTCRSIIGVNDAVRVGSLTLMTGTGTPAGVIPEAPLGVVDNRVILVNCDKKIVWQYGKFGVSGSTCDLLNVPVYSTFIKCKKNCKKQYMCDCESVLITDQGNNRVIRVNKHKEIIWQYPGLNVDPLYQLNSPNSAEKLDNGFYLIADENNSRALEVNHCDEVIRVFTASGTLGACAGATRLCNGNTLLVDAGNSRIVEVDKDDCIVWQYITNAESRSVSNSSPSSAIRQKSGNTIISDQLNNRVIVINKTTLIKNYYGLPLTGGVGPIGTNTGYSKLTTQLGLYAPYNAKIIHSCD
jgi:hypothetical protein